MRKLSLELDSLRVASFETAAAPAVRGTVQAHQESAISNCGCVSTIFSTGCYDFDGDTVYDYFAPGNGGGPRNSEFGCTNEN